MNENSDLKILPATDEPPFTSYDLDKLRVDVRVGRFVNSFLKSGSIEGVSKDLAVSQRYVNDMLRNPLIRGIIRNELSLSIQSTRITLGRIALVLWRRLEDPEISTSEAIRLSETLIKLLPQTSTDSPKQLTAAVTTLLSYEVLEKNTEDPVDTDVR